MTMKILLMIAGILLMTIIPYLLGCSNGAILLSKYILKDDVRDHGSGNAGLTNFRRVYGGKLTIVVVVIDSLKTVVGVFLGMLGAYLMHRGGIEAISMLQSRYIAGVFCELGHMYPVMFGFKGGKGIMCGGILAIMVGWPVAVVVWGAFVILTLLTRYVSVGSIAAGTLFPVMGWILYRDPLILVCAIIVGGLIDFQHRGNIVRLAHGTENKFSFHRNSK